MKIIIEKYEERKSVFHRWVKMPFKIGLYAAETDESLVSSRFSREIRVSVSISVSEIEPFESQSQSQSQESTKLSLSLNLNLINSILTIMMSL